MTDLVHISGGPTKPEIIAVSLSKLDLRDGDTFVDIGCGTGAVSIAASRIARDLNIYAIDARAEAIDVAAQNFETFKVPNVTLINGEVSQVLTEREDIGRIDCAFLGGTKNVENILKILAEKKVRSIVVNAVRIETVVRTMDIMRELGIYDEVVHIAVSRSKPITGETMFKPENPVYIIVARSDKN